MIDILKNRTYRHLFLAQVVALVGTGLATVALGLLAYDLAGKNAGAVLGTALAIKMVAYVLVAPLAGAYANRVPRRALLVALDLVRLADARCRFNTGDIDAVRPPGHRRVGHAGADSGPAVAGVGLGARRHVVAVTSC